MGARKKTGYEVQAEIFKAEMTRRTVNDCVNALGRLRSMRPDVTATRLRPMSDHQSSEAWAEVGVELQDPTSGRRRAGWAYIVPGTPPVAIDEQIQEAVEWCEELLRATQAEHRS